MTYDAASFHEELVAAGLLIRSVGSDGSIDWAGTQSAANLVTADTVRAKHDPTKRERDERTARQALLDLADRMESGLATAQETRLGIAKLIRRMVR